MQMTWDYIAGFTDGEGHLGAVRFPVIILGQKTPDVLLSIQAFLRERDIFARVNQRKAVSGQTEGLFVLTVSRRLDVYLMCLELEDRVIVKRDQLATLFDWYDNHQPRRWWTDIDRDWLAATVAAGYSLAEIARRLNCARGLVELAARRYQIVVPDGGRFVDGLRTPAIPRVIREKTGRCLDCGKTIYPQGQRCNSCATKLRHLVNESSFRGQSSTSVTLAENQ